MELSSQPKWVQQAFQNQLKVNYVDTSEPDLLGELPSTYWEQVGDSLGYYYSPMIWQMRNGKSFNVDQNFVVEDNIDFVNEQDSHILLNAVSQSHLDFLRRKNAFNRQVKYDASQAGFFAHMTGALLDPLTWAIPFSITGKTFYSGFKSGAKAGAIYGGVSEGIRAPFDSTSKLTESVSNVGIVTAFSGLLGGVVKSSHTWGAVKSSANKIVQHEKDMNSPIFKINKDKPYDLAEGTTNPLSRLLEGPAREILRGKYPQMVKETILSLINDGSFLTNLAKTGVAHESVTGNLGVHLGNYSDMIFNLQNMHHQIISGRKQFVKKHIAPRMPITGIYMGTTGFKGLLTGKTDFNSWLQKLNEYRIMDVDELKSARGKTSRKEINQTAHESMAEVRLRLFGSKKQLTPLEKQAIEELNKFYDTTGSMAREVGVLEMKGLKRQYQWEVDVKHPNQIKWWEDLIRTWEGKNRKRLDNLKKQYEDKSRGLTKKQIKLMNDLEAKIKSHNKELNKHIRNLDEAKKNLEDTLKREKEIAPPFEERHYNRIWDTSAIIANRETFTRLVEAWFRFKPSKWVFDEKANHFKEKTFDTSPKGIRERAEKFVRKLLKEEVDEELIDMQMPLKSSFLNSRQMDAPNWFRANVGENNKSVGLFDFIDKDVSSVAKNYVLRIGPKIEFAKIFNGRKITKVLEDVEEKMHAEKYDEKKIIKAKVAIKTMYDRVVGQVQKEPHRWDNVLATEIRKLAQVVYLGGSGIASIADMGNIIFQSGFKPFQIYLDVLASGDYSKAVKSVWLGGEHQYLIGGTRRIIVEDLINPTPLTGYRKVTDRMTETFYNINLLKPLTHTFKTMIGLFSQHDIIEKALRFNKLTDMEKWELARFGITAREAEILVKSPHIMNDSKTFHYMNMDNWTDDVILKSGEKVTANDAKRIFGASLRMRQNINVLTAQAGDKFSLVDGVAYLERKPWMKKYPNFFKTDRAVSVWTENKKTGEILYKKEMVRIESGLMAMPFQFWNYGLAAQQKILGSMLDPHRPLARKIYGGAIMLGLGYMIARSRMPDGMWDKMPAHERLLKGIHLGGLTGMYTDLFYMNSAMFHGMSGLDSRETGIPTMYSPDFTDAITEPFGAGVGLTVDTGRAIGKMVTGEFGKGLADLPKPYQYVPFMREQVREMNRYLRN